MATATKSKSKKSDKAKAKSRKKAKPAEDDLDEELGGLEELDDIEAELDEEPDEVEEDEEAEEEKPKRSRSRKGKAKTETKAKGKAKSAGKKAKGKGKAKAKAADKEEVSGVGTADVAEEAGVTPRELRVFLRANAEKFPKPADGYRWPSLENKTVQRIIKAVKAEYEEE